jgi:hypothetical protein
MPSRLCATNAIAAIRRGSVEMINGRLTELISCRESLRIVPILDRICRTKGCERAVLIREAVRFWLASNSHLTPEEKKDLGVA